MNFDLTDEQRMLGETVERFIADRYDFETRQKSIRGPEGFSREVWGELAELGVLALPFSEEDGGFGAGGVETMLVMDALGRGLVVEPYLSTVVLCGTALRLAASPEQKASRIHAIVGGQRLLALAHHEPHGPRALTTPQTTRYAKAGDGFALDGGKSAVLHGGSADELIVSAAGEAGATLFLVDPRADGVTVTSRAAYDGQRVAEIRLSGVPLGRDAVLGGLGCGEAILRQVMETGAAAVCAEAVGVMASTLDTTVEYLKTRKQFGVAIGSFQALQHRSVEMLIQLELARSMSMLAAMSLDLPDGPERARNIGAAKVQIGRSGKFVGQQAVQLHGAIGITAEYRIGHAFKRLTAIDTLFGDCEHHLDVLAAS